MTSAVYFADASFWIAVLSARDTYHQRALRWRTYLSFQRLRVLTTQLVLVEMLNSMAGSAERGRAIALYQGCTFDRTIEVAPLEAADFSAALGLYRTHSDKEWGITDCYSFVLMQRRGVSLALTADHHFSQAGFDALLLRDPPPAP